MTDLATRLAAVDPNHLIELMTIAGWTRVGGRTNAYTRLSWPPDAHRNASLLVPLDPTAPEYPEQIAALLVELDDAAHLGRTARTVLDALGGPLATPSTEPTGFLTANADPPPRWESWIPVAAVVFALSGWAAYAWVAFG